MPTKTPTPTKPTNFTAGQLILQALEAGYNAETPRDYIGISQIPYCIRKLYRQSTSNEKTELTDQVLLSFLTGSATHEKLQQLLWKHRGSLPFKYRKAEKDVEIITPSGNVLRGHADLIAEIDGKEVAIDFKITNENKFKMVKEPDFHYQDQLMLYAYGLGLEYCQLCYVDKSNGKEKTFSFPVDLPRVTMLMQKYDSLLDAIEHMQEPEKPFETATENWQCRYCQYSKKCWGWIEQEKNTEELATIPTDLESQYLELTEQVEELDDQIGTLKAQIEELAAGRDAIGTYLKATFVPPSITLSYDKAKLEKSIPLDLLKPCEKATNRKGYYRISGRAQA